MSEGEIFEEGKTYFVAVAPVVSDRNYFMNDQTVVTINNQTAVLHDTPVINGNNIHYFYYVSFVPEHTHTPATDPGTSEPAATDTTPTDPEKPDDSLPLWIIVVAVGGIAAAVIVILKKK